MSIKKKIYSKLFISFVFGVPGLTKTILVGNASLAVHHESACKVLCVQQVELLREHYKGIVHILQDLALLPQRHVKLSSRVDGFESVAQSSALNLSKLQLQMEQFGKTPSLF